MKNIPNATFSFILPTRGRPDNLTRLFDSFKCTTKQLGEIEVVLVIDQDDREMKAFAYEGIPIKTVSVPPGLNMGELNMAAYEASSGEYIMILNDDVVIRTEGWDETILNHFNAYADGVVLVHVNDLIFKERLCTFPFVTRTFCRIAEGLCPKGYYRHRIDDHIYNIFNLLSIMGKKRIIYLPDVIFEHEHYVTTLSGKRKYKLDDHIVEADVRLFDDLLPQRKRIAVELMEHIDQFARCGNTTNQIKKLKPVEDSISIRKREYIHIRPEGFIPASANTRVTVAVVSANSHSPIAQKCLQLIKRNTNNFELILLDNQFSPDFNHPREMNRIMEIVQTDYLVLMDDDVFVDTGWLDGLLRCMQADVAVVTPLHKDRGGKLSYAGIVFKPDGSGEHGHILSRPESVRPIMSLCSALLLVDMNKCRHVRFDESYHKYFLDIDYGLRIWEAGYQVVCSPFTTVTHLGGGTLAHGSFSSNLLFQQQKKHFQHEWYQTGRFAKLEENTFCNFPELIRLSRLGKQVAGLLEGPSSESMRDFRERALLIHNQTSDYPALKDFLHTQAREKLGHEVPSIEHSEKGHLAFLMGLAGHPVLAGQLKGFHAIFCDQNYYAIPASERIFDLARIYRNYYSIAYSALRMEDLEKAVQDANEDGIPLPEKSKPNQLRQASLAAIYELQMFLLASLRILNKLTRPIFLEMLRPGFSRRAVTLAKNGVRALRAVRKPAATTVSVEKSIQATLPTGKAYHHLAQLLQLKYHRFRMMLHAEKKRWVIQKTPVTFRNRTDEPNSPKLHLPAECSSGTKVIERDYLGYQLIEEGDRFKGIPTDEAGKPTGESHGECFARSLAGLRRMVQEKTPRLVTENYKGYQLYAYEHYFFAMPQTAGFFSTKKLKRVDFESAHTIPELKQRVDWCIRTESNDRKDDSLCLAFLPLPKMVPFLHILHKRRPTLLGNVKESEHANDFPYIPLNEKEIQVLKELPVEAYAARSLTRLRTYNFKSVIVPVVFPETFRTEGLFRVAASIADKVELAYPDGSMYAFVGEQLNRLVYNSTYLHNMLRSLSTMRGRSILEVGCSDGMVCHLMEKAGAEKVVGIDVLNTLGCRFPSDKIEYLQMDGSRLDFSDETFDLAFSIATLEHVPDPLGVMWELKRVIKRGGLGYIQAGPLYFSPFGHHMFEYFKNYPWLHLRMTPERIVKLATREGTDRRIEQDLGISCSDYVNGMLNTDHLNGLSLNDYHLREFVSSDDVKVLQLNISCEGRELLSPSLRSELADYASDQLVEHGFEIIFERKQ